ncbi:MAG: pseudaminic acid cytidylyltransferase [Lachnospiraceae bacterium]|nr:pseudaminic acid cytidylyltransferase [Lachnospiraceae bacterium]
MSSIAIITARGGSKRIPKKNIKEFCGKPIMEYSIQAALESGVFDEVMVSTDSEEIAELARKAGASVPFMRSADTSNDYATMKDVLEEVLSCYAQAGKLFDEMCCIYPTAPFVTARKLRKAHEILNETGAESVLPVVRFSFPPQRGLIMRDGLLHYQYPEYQSSRSQDLEPIYHDCGQFYFYRVNRDLTFNSDSYAPIIVSEMEVQDIDNETDWEIAELKYKLMVNRKGE